jgi:hypothetical protein
VSGGIESLSNFTGDFTGSVAIFSPQKRTTFRPGAATTERRRGILGLRPRLCKSGGGPCGGLWHSPAPQPLRFAVPVDRVRQKLPVKGDPPIIKIIVSGGEAVRRRHFSGDNVIVRSGWRRRVPSREMGCATRQVISNDIW